MTTPPIVHDVLRSPGQPLDATTRLFFEKRFAQDFSSVRVHADSKAADSANSVHARAYTVGKDIVFGPGEFSPHTDASRRLLAHELTHVVQQSAGGISGDSEAAASAAADRISRGNTVGEIGLGGAPVSLQRDDKDTKQGIVPGQSTTTSTESPVDEFDFDKAEIPPQHLQRLAALRMKLIAASTAKLILTGHTDTVGTEQYNESLGKRRALAVRDFLSQGNGVAPGRIEIVSRGELVPAEGQTPAKRDPSRGEKNPKNRRVEIQIVGLPSSETKTDIPSPGSTPAPPQKPPVVLVPSIKDLCIVYPDLCNPPDPHQLPPDFWKEIPPAKRTQKSVLDVINENVVDPVVKTLTKGLPKAVREKILDLAHDGVEKGITSAASSAAAAAGLDSKAQQAVEKAVEAGIKYKGEQSGQGDRK